MKQQILVAVSLFGGMYHVMRMAEAGAEMLSIFWVVIGTGYIVHQYKETAFQHRRDVEYCRKYMDNQK